AMCSLPTISPRSWWTGQLMARVPTANTCTSEAPHAISCAAARMDAGGILSTITKGLRCDSPPYIMRSTAAVADGATLQPGVDDHRETALPLLLGQPNARVH